MSLGVIVWSSKPEYVYLSAVHICPLYYCKWTYIRLTVRVYLCVYICYRVNRRVAFCNSIGGQRVCAHFFLYVVHIQCVHGCVCVCVCGSGCVAVWVCIEANKMAG